jgi:hypothetical protein
MNKKKSFLNSRLVELEQPVDVEVLLEIRAVDHLRERSTGEPFFAGDVLPNVLSNASPFLTRSSPLATSPRLLVSWTFVAELLGEEVEGPLVTHGQSRATPEAASGKYGGRAALAGLVLDDAEGSPGVRSPSSMDPELASRLAKRRR